MAFMRRSAAACGVVISACGLGALVLAAEVRTQGGDIEAGKRVYDKANCVGCHKWHGGGGGGYGGDPGRCARCCCRSSCCFRHPYAVMPRGL